jgi:tRNA-dihydrouridine synthase
LNQTQFAFIDINMGCPVKKVFSNGDGSALLADGSKLYRVAKAAVEASEKPVSAKIRIGIDSEHINCMENVRILEDAGIQAIAIHGRTKDQMYAGKADWDTIARVWIWRPFDYRKRRCGFRGQYLAIKEMTGKGVMIGRGIWAIRFCPTILSYRKTKHTRSRRSGKNDDGKASFRISFGDER